MGLSAEGSINVINTVKIPRKQHRSTRQSNQYNNQVTTRATSDEVSLALTLMSLIYTCVVTSMFQATNIIKYY